MTLASSRCGSALYKRITRNANCFVRSLRSLGLPTHTESTSQAARRCDSCHNDFISAFSIPSSAFRSVLLHSDFSPLTSPEPSSDNGKLSSQHDVDRFRVRDVFLLENARRQYVLVICI